MRIVLTIEDRSLLYAEACFETFRVVNGAIFNWQGHEERLRSGLSLFGLALPHGMEQRCLAESKNKGSDVLVRITATGGNASRGLLPKCERHVDVYIQSWPYTPRTTAVHLRSVTWPLPLLPRPAKLTADYAQTIRGLRDLKGKGLLAENEEALICDADMLYSATTSNVLLFAGGVWWTPDADVVLPGVVRRAFVDAGVVHYSACARSLAERCEAMALTNSGWLIRSVTSINGRPLRTHGAPFDQLVAVLQGRSGIPEEFLCG